MQSVEQYLNPAPDLESMVMAVSMLAVLIFQPTQRPGEEELKRTQQLSRSFLVSHADNYAAYIELVQRVLLTGEYQRLYGPGHLPATASAWMQDTRCFGLSATWYKALQNKRVSQPLYKLAWKGLAEAILEMEETKVNMDLMEYWLQWFQKRQAITEGLLLLQFILHVK